jgi:hypothetical protein
LSNASTYIPVDKAEKVILYDVKLIFKLGSLAQKSFDPKIILQPWKV